MSQLTADTDSQLVKRLYRQDLNTVAPHNNPYNALRQKHLNCELDKQTGGHPEHLTDIVILKLKRKRMNIWSNRLLMYVMLPISLKTTFNKLLANVAFS